MSTGTPQTARHQQTPEIQALPVAKCAEYQDHQFEHVVPGDGDEGAQHSSESVEVVLDFSADPI